MTNKNTSTEQLYLFYKDLYHFTGDELKAQNNRIEDLLSGLDKVSDMLEKDIEKKYLTKYIGILKEMSFLNKLINNNIAFKKDENKEEVVREAEDENKEIDGCRSGGLVEEEFGCAKCGKYNGKPFQCCGEKCKTKKNNTKKKCCAGFDTAFKSGKVVWYPWTYKNDQT